MRYRFAILLMLALLGGGARAQLLPQIPGVPLPQLPGDLLQQPVRQVTGLVDRTAATTLEDTRRQRITAFLRDNRATVAPDDRGFPAVRGEVLLTSPAPDDLARLAGQGFTIIDDRTIAGLGLRTVRLATPGGMKLKQALKLARRIAGDRISADDLHFRSGEAMVAVPTGDSLAIDHRAPAQPVRIGMIDGGVAGTPLIPSRVTQ